MSSLINRYLKIPYWLIYLLFIIVVIVISLVLYDMTDEGDTKTVSLIGGIASGFVVYLTTMATVIRPILKVDKFDKLGVRNLLQNRHDKEYYKALVSRSKGRVDVMGASCTRFILDFLDLDSDDKVLVDALRRHKNLKIRLLIPTDAKMSEGSRSNLQGVLPIYEKLKETFRDRVELKRFDSIPHHSFVLTDNDLVAGPIFEGDKSRHAPAVHVSSWSAFGEKYLNFFEDQWASAS